MNTDSMNTETDRSTQGASSLHSLVSRRRDAPMDADGHCTVCGCEVREYEGGTDEEAMRNHVCPPGFRTTTNGRLSNGGDAHGS